MNRYFYYLLIFAFLPNGLQSQHINDFISDVYDQNWVMKNEIRGITNTSFSEGRNKELWKMKWFYKWGISGSQEPFMEDSVVKSCFDSLSTENRCNNYHLQEETKLITYRNSNFIQEWFFYNQNGQIENRIFENLTMRTRKEIRNNSLILGNSRVDLIRNDDGVLVKKIEYDLPDSVSLDLFELDLILSAAIEKINTIWHFEYDEQRHLKMVTIDKRRKNGEMRRYRTVVVENEKGLPVKTTWYAGELKEENIRFSDTYDYEFAE